MRCCCCYVCVWRAVHQLSSSRRYVTGRKRLQRTFDSCDGSPSGGGGGGPSEVSGELSAAPMRHVGTPLARAPPAVECRLKRRFSWLGSVTYFSVCRRRRRPGVRSPDHVMHFAKRCPPPPTVPPAPLPTAIGIRDTFESGAGLTEDSRRI